MILSNKHKSLRNRESTVESFQHRTWNHICFVYSSITKTSALYYNGKLSGTKNHSSLPIIPGSEAIDEYSFIFGQEPDSLRGDYSYHQALFGSIAEVNLLNISIEKSEINDMANLNSFPNGNVISWQKQHFKWPPGRPLKGRLSRPLKAACGGL